MYATAGGNANKQFARAKYGSTWTAWKNSLYLEDAPLVTQSSPGFMSSADKTILDSATNFNTPGTLVKRDENGQINLKSPTQNYHAATVSYVDSTVKTERDRVDALEIKTRDSGWVACPLKSGIKQQSGRGFEVRRVGDIVYLDWGVSSDGLDANASTAVATVPVEFRPTLGHNYGLYVSSRSIASGGRLVVDISGDITVTTLQETGSYYLAASGYNWFLT